jgi:hypothetical protein
VDWNFQFYYTAKSQLNLSCGFISSAVYLSMDIWMFNFLLGNYFEHLRCLWEDVGAVSLHHPSVKSFFFSFYTGWQITNSCCWILSPISKHLQNLCRRNPLHYLQMGLILTCLFHCIFFSIFEWYDFRNPSLGLCSLGISHLCFRSA